VSLRLEVEDTEGLGSKQEDQEVQIIAEAFEISVEFPDFDKDDFRLDFKAVRVNDIAE